MFTQKLRTADALLLDTLLLPHVLLMSSEAFYGCPDCSYFLHLLQLLSLFLGCDACATAGAFSAAVLLLLLSLGCTACATAGAAPAKQALHVVTFHLSQWGQCQI
jgi:hypothetical protein